MGDPYNMKYKQLSEADIFDVYGCEFIISNVADKEIVDEVSSRIEEIWQAYRHAAKIRAGWILEQCGYRDVKPDSLRGIVDEISKSFNANLIKETTNLKDGNLMGAIMRSHQAAGTDLTGFDTKRFGVDFKKAKKVADTSKIGLGNWAEIAK